MLFDNVTDTDIVHLFLLTLILFVCLFETDIDNVCLFDISRGQTKLVVGSFADFCCFSLNLDTPGTSGSAVVP